MKYLFIILASFLMIFTLACSGPVGDTMEDPTFELGDYDKSRWDRSRWR